MDKSRPNHLALSCISALVVSLVPATQAQETVRTIEQAPENLFETERDNAMAKFLEAGPISVRPHLYADTYYDDNITLASSARLDDWVWRIMPGALFGVGEFRGDKGTYVSLDYTLGGNIYTDHNEFNAVDHHVIASGGWKLSKLTLGLSQSYTIENGKQIEAGGFVEQESFVTLLTSKYDLSEKTSVELNGRQSIIHSEEKRIGEPNPELVSINEWVTEAWGNYKVTEKVTAGVGATLGFRDTQSHETPIPDFVDSPSQVFEQILARGLYHMSEKVDLMGSVGLQFSQFQGGDDKGPDFVFNLAGSWHPLENTYATLEAFRHDVPSYIYNGRNYTVTGFRASVKQLLLEKYTASLATGYEYSDYTETADANVIDRTDDYYWIRPGFDYTINERWMVGIFYQFRTKSSSDPNFDYHNNQAGLYSNYRF
jgi:hypothetical protein